MNGSTGEPATSTCCGWSEQASKANHMLSASSRELSRPSYAVSRAPRGHGLGMERRILGQLTVRLGSSFKSSCHRRVWHPNTNKCSNLSLASSIQAATFLHLCQRVVTD